MLSRASARRFLAIGLTEPRVSKLIVATPAFSIRQYRKFLAASSYCKTEPLYSILLVSRDVRVPGLYFLDPFLHSPVPFTTASNLSSAPRHCNLTTSSKGSTGTLGASLYGYVFITHFCAPYSNLTSRLN